MKGDFSRLSFDAGNHFSQVLLQQGRVTLDADVNEQGAILLHYLRTLARDLIGPFGGPSDEIGFELAVHTDEKGNKSLVVGAGRYYVDGILCESDGCNYAMQPDYTPVPADGKGNGDAVLEWLKQQSPTAKTFWFYLDVWERHITAIEDDRIREVALGGPDTSTRTKVVWQVKAVAVDGPPAQPDEVKKKIEELQAEKAKIDQQIASTTDASVVADLKKKSDAIQNQIEVLQSGSAESLNACRAPLDKIPTISDALLAARLDPGLQIKDPCTISPDAHYRGAQNQLYRVEIHEGSDSGAPSFKWSRDNGSIATRWFSTEGQDLVVGNTRGFTAGNWVELTDEANDLLGVPGLMAKLSKVEGDRLTLDPDSYAGVPLPDINALNTAKVRRWDQTENDDIVLHDGAVPIDAIAITPKWIDLEDGVQVQFASGGTYRSGDYWLIAARVATGTIDWPATTAADGTASGEMLPPFGVEHHYAPIGFVAWSANASTGGANNAGGGAYQFSDCRCRILPINTCGRIKASVSVSGTRLNAADAVKAESAGATLAVNRVQSMVSARPVVARRTAVSLVGRVAPR